MSEITNIVWNGEPLMAVIKFGEGFTYTVYSDKLLDETDNFIYSASFSLNEGNSNVNPLGVNTSNTLNMQIYDNNDSLSPANTDSIYAGKIVNGVEVDLFISYDGIDWSPYGIWYTTNWSGSFDNGRYNVVSVSLEDKLNTIGNYEIPSLPAYGNVVVGSLIKSVFNSLGINDDGYYLEPSLNLTLLYGVTIGTKVREFLNNICQLLFARVTIDRTGKILIIPALNVYSTGNELVLNSYDLGSLQNKNTSNINYNEICVKYLSPEVTSRETLFKDNNHKLVVGTNIINDIKFESKVLSVENVECLYTSANNTAIIDGLHYQAYQDGIAITIVLNGEDIDDCQLIGEGIVVNNIQKNVVVNVDNASIIGGTTFNFDTKQMMVLSQATQIANNLKAYLSAISKNVIMSGSVLTPMLYTGDKITIQNTSSMYDGVYKVIALNIKFGESYSLDFTLIRLS